jgi:phosphate transport system substrate-binding protein
MRTLLALALILLCGCKEPEGPATDDPAAPEVPLQQTLVGGGPVALAEAVTRWAAAWNLESGNRVVYRDIGGPAALRQVQSREIDFACIDAPLSVAELDRMALRQFPVAVYGVVPVVNLPDTGTRTLLLDGSTLSAIYLGEITRWDDARIAQLNPDLALPATAVVAVHRADEAGATWVFSDWLAKVSPVWRARFGRDRVIPWTSGVGVRGDDGVVAFVARVPGAIGYVARTLQEAAGVRPVQLVNAAGHEVAATLASLRAAAAGADWRGTPGFAVTLGDDPNAESWPITGAVLATVPANMPDRTKAVAMLRFFSASLRRGLEAREAGLVVLAEGAVAAVEQSWFALKSRDAPFGPPR